MDVNSTGQVQSWIANLLLDFDSFVALRVFRSRFLCN